MALRFAVIGLVIAFATFLLAFCIRTFLRVWIFRNYGWNWDTYFRGFTDYIIRVCCRGSSVQIPENATDVRTPLVELDAIVSTNNLPPDLQEEIDECKHACKSYRVGGYPSEFQNASETAWRIEIINRKLKSLQKIVSPYIETMPTRTLDEIHQLVRNKPDYVLVPGYRDDDRLVEEKIVRADNQLFQSIQELISREIERREGMAIARGLVKWPLDGKKWGTECN